MRVRFDRIRVWLAQEIHRENAYLVPLRLFIGIGWIRASLEKIINPGWLRGSALSEFLNTQLTGGQVAFPFYRRLITLLFVPQAAALSWIIILGQILVGIAILFGILTNFALIWGIFMNLNFILAGQISPSAFYVVIQVALLVTNTGVIFGLDRFLSERVAFCFLSAQPSEIRRYWRLEKACFFLSALVGAVIGLAAIPYIRDYSPKSVEDPAMLVLVLSLVTSLMMLIRGARIRSGAAVFPSYSSKSLLTLE